MTQERIKDLETELEETANFREALFVLQRNAKHVGRKFGEVGVNQLVRPLSDGVVYKREALTETYYFVEHYQGMIISGIVFEKR